MSTTFYVVSFLNTISIPSFMLSKRTIIGIGVGSAIIIIGLASLFTNIGIQTIQVDETFGLGESTSYRFMAPESLAQHLKITGDTFDVEMTSPVFERGDTERPGLQIPLQSYKNELTLDWMHLVNGESNIKIQNTGNSDLNIKGILHVSTDPIFVTYDIMVMVAGVVIIGFSLGFSTRKPRGF